MNAPKGCILPKPETGVGLWEISFDKKEGRHWKPLFSEGGYWVCQDPWELRERNSALEKYRERSGKAKTMAGCILVSYGMNRFASFGRMTKYALLKKKWHERNGSGTD